MEYVVIGGVGVNVHGVIRATEDLDLFIRPEPGNVTRFHDVAEAGEARNDLRTARIREREMKGKVESA